MTVPAVAPGEHQDRDDVGGHAQQGEARQENTLSR